MADQNRYRQIGSGLNVFETEPVEGRVRWLDSPADVIRFVRNENVAESIVISRGGTTTFMAPALSAGVRGLITLQGAPESHLGIVSREFGIPCLMAVSFTEGVQTSRGETVPADGTMVRLDVSGSPTGAVLVEGAGG